MAPLRLLLLLLLALVLNLFRVDGFFVGTGKGRFGGQRLVTGARSKRDWGPPVASAVRLSATQPDEPLGGLRPRGRLLHLFPASKRPALAASVLLATCLSLNTLQPSRVQAADPSFSTAVLAASSPAPPSALGPYQAKLDELVNRLGRLEFRMDESDISRKQEAAEAAKERKQEAAKAAKERKQEAAEAEKRSDAKMAAMEKRSDAKMAAMEKRSDAKMAAMEKIRKQDAAEAEKRSDAKMAAMEIERKKGEEKNFFVSAISATASVVSAFSAAVANNIAIQKAPDPQDKP